MAALLTVTNHHTRKCGLSPEIMHAVGDCKFVAYFENAFDDS